MSNSYQCSDKFWLKMSHIIKVNNSHGTGVIEGLDFSAAPDVEFCIVVQYSGSNPEISSLVINSSIIPDLSNEILKHFPDLNQLSFTDCTIQKISDDAFSGSKEITYITLRLEP